jgi:hypothetical protein
MRATAGMQRGGRAAAVEPFDAGRPETDAGTGRLLDDHGVPQRRYMTMVRSVRTRRCPASSLPARDHVAAMNGRFGDGKVVSAGHLAAHLRAGMARRFRPG